MDSELTADVACFVGVFDLLLVFGLLLTSLSCGLSRSTSTKTCYRGWLASAALVCLVWLAICKGVLISNMNSGESVNGLILVGGSVLDQI